jgi:hypothetical protein
MSATFNLVWPGESPHQSRLQFLNFMNMPRATSSTVATALLAFLLQNLSLCRAQTNLANVGQWRQLEQF